MPEKNPAQAFLVLSRMIRSLRNPNYRVYMLGSLSQFASLSMQIFTGPLIIYRLTDSPALLGVMALVGSLPMIVMSIVGGAIADRVPKKKVIIAGLCGSTLVSLSIALLLTAGIISKENTNSYLILMGAMLCMGSLNGLVMPALQALTPEIVEKDELMNAVALNSLGINTLNLMAPAAAGFMIDAFDFNLIYFIMSGLFACSIFFIVFVRSTKNMVIISGSILGEIQKGLRYIKQDKLILTVLGFSLIVTVLSTPYQQLMPIFTEDILNVGPTGQGILMAVSGAGAMIASIILAALPNKKRGRLLLISGIVSGLALVGFSFSSTMGLSMSVMAFIGLGQTFRVTIGSTLLQSYTEAEYRGRVMSLFHIQWGLTSVCTFLAGVLSEVVSVQWVLGVMSMILIAFSILAIIVMPSLRRLD